MSIFLAEQTDEFEQRFSSSNDDPQDYNAGDAREWFDGCQTRYLTKESAVYRYAYDQVASFIAAHDEDDFSL